MDRYHIACKFFGVNCLRHHGKLENVFGKINVWILRVENVYFS